MSERGFKKTGPPPKGGPAGPLLDGFKDALVAQGYASDTSGRHLLAAAHLCQWVKQRGVAIADLDEALLARFVRHLPTCRCRGQHGSNKRTPFRVHMFLRYLREAGVVAAYAPGPTYSPLTNKYGAWMRDRGLAGTTISGSLPMVEALLGIVDDDPTGLDAARVRGFVLDYIQRHAPASACWVTTTIRCFLRYLAVQGLCSADLVESVPKVPTWRLAKLPDYLPTDDVERLIAAGAT